MGFWNRLRAKPEEKNTATKPVLKAGRTTAVANPWQTMLSQTLPRPMLRTEGVAEKLRVIRDVAPDASMAIWNTVRLGVSDWSLAVLSGESEAGEKLIDQQKTTMLNEWAKTGIAKDYGKGLVAFMSTAILTLMTEGAVAAEVELSPGLDNVVDWHLVTPSRVQARRVKKDEATPERPEGTLVYVWTNTEGEQKDLSETQFIYIPMDPEIGDPFGRSPILPSLMQIEFQMALLADLRAVVHNQGYPRIDVSVMEEAVVAAAPASLQQYGKEEELGAFVQTQIETLAQKYGELQPDDAFIHLDNVNVSTWAPGTSLDFGKVEDIVTSQIVTSLKQLPILLGRNEGSTETHGTVQYRIYVKGVESLREKVAELVQFCSDLTLRVWGEAGYTWLEFEEIRHTDRQKEATAGLLEHQALTLATQEGWINDDEAANILYGHDATGEKQKKEPQTVVVQPGEAPPPAEAPAAPEGDGTPDGAPGEHSEKHVHDEACGCDERVQHLSTAKFYENVTQQDGLRKALINETDILQDQLTQFFAEQYEMYADRVEKMDENWTERAAAEGSEAWAYYMFMHDNEQQQVKLANVMLPHYGYMIGESGRAAIDLLKVDVKFDLLNPRAMAYLNEKQGVFRNIQETTSEQIMGVVRGGFLDGKHPYDVARSIRELPQQEMNKYRSEMIARTEMLDASSAGTFDGYHQSGVVEEVRWVATEDERTCDICAAMDGNVTVLGEKFEDVLIRDGELVGQIEGERPPIHPMCRCTTVVETFKSFDDTLKEMKEDAEQASKNVTLQEDLKDWRPNILTNENAPAWKEDKAFDFGKGVNPSYTAVDETKQRWICKWNDGFAGKAEDEYNAFRMDQFIGLNRVPEVRIVDPEVMAMREVTYAEEALTRSGMKMSENPIFMRWEEGYKLPPDMADTIFYRIGTERGSMWVDDIAASRFGTGLEQQSWIRAEEAKMHFFDSLIGNTQDRHYKNFLVDEAREQFLVIDNSYSLQVMRSAGTFGDGGVARFGEQADKAMRVVMSMDNDRGLTEIMTNFATKTNTEIDAFVDGMVVNGRAPITEGFKTEYARYLKKARDEIASRLKYFGKMQ